MADFDTKVLYLETPATSAPKASYIIGVRVKNLGLFATATSGYVQVFDKDTGELVKTYSVASATLDPGEEKQAFAFEIWDLTEEVAGKQFILSGMVTSEGDTDPSNDILNPTTVTVIEAPPPPPPPVTPHSSQHEDGGNDELDLTGLHGQLADSQPYADHASKHQNGGEDELSIAGLGGNLADPQTPTDHGNERHVESYATEGQLTNHNNDPDPHDLATTLEKTAEKGQVEGYAELDDTARVPADQLGSGAPSGAKYLRDDRTWQVGPDPGTGTPWANEGGMAPSVGSGAGFANSEHDHGGGGGLDGGHAVNITQAAPVNLLNRTVQASCMAKDIQDFEHFAVRAEGYLDLADEPGPGSTVTIDLEIGVDAGTLITRTTLAIPISGPSEDGHLYFHIMADCFTGTTQSAGRAVFTVGPTSACTCSGITGTGIVSRAQPFLVRVKVSIVGTAVVTTAIARSDIESERLQFI